MKLITKLVIDVKTGFLPHLTNEIYKRGCSIRNLIALESEKKSDLFTIDICYSNSEKYQGLVNKISRHEENFKIISSENELESSIEGGLLRIAGKLPVNNLIDYELNVLGASTLALKKLELEGYTSIFSGIKKNIGLFNIISDRSDSHSLALKYHSLAERDSVIINRFCGLNAYPVIIKYNQIEDIFKTIQGIAPTFSAIRFMNIEDCDDLLIYERLYSNFSSPVLTQCFDELPLFLITAISHLLKKNNLNFRECNVGFIGLNISALRMVRLLTKLGLQRILGYDNNEKLMHNFEKESGLATTQENIFNNSDLIILFKDQFSSDDFNKIGSGQIIISLCDRELDESLIFERGVREFLNKGWMNYSALYPGMLRGLIDSGKKHIDDECLIAVSDNIIKLNSSDEIIPDVFSDINNKISDVIKGEVN